MKDRLLEGITWSDIDELQGDGWLRLLSSRRSMLWVTFRNIHPCLMKLAGWQTSSHTVHSRGTFDEMLAMA